MSKKLHKLNYQPEYNFIVIGITSDENDYRLIWEINKELGWNLERKENYRWYDKTIDKESEFSLFSYTDEDTYVLYKLISNKNEGFFLLDKLKNIDYLLLIYDEPDSDIFESISERLKKLKAIRAVFNIDLSKHKNRERLLII